MPDSETRKIHSTRRGGPIAATLAVVFVSGCSSPPASTEPEPDTAPLPPSRIVLEVETDKWEGEMLYVAIFQSADTFLEVDHWTAGISVPVTVPVTRVVFDEVPTRPSAISGFIDIKRDETLTRNIIGLPVEPWGFSNDLSIFFARPRFEDAQVPLTPPETVVRFAMGTSLDRSEIRQARRKSAEASRTEVDQP
ncbi:MAG: DUF2141 domain-containing protein [Phycisphaera sp.]|nr:DUF2141 domain-containing protein [Phycisphaera sp.]